MATCNACRKIGFNAWQRNADTHVKTLPEHGKRAANALATAKTRHTHGKDIGNIMAKVWQRRRKTHGKETTETRQQHGTSMANTLDKHCNGLATSRHKAWQRHRTSVALTTATRFCCSGQLCSACCAPAMHGLACTTSGQIAHGCRPGS